MLSLMLILLLLPAFHQSVNINQLRPYVEAFLQDLEVTTNPPESIAPPKDPQDFAKATNKFVDSLLEELSQGSDALKYHPILTQMVKLYSSISLNDPSNPPALSLPKALSFGDPCNPHNHFHISPEELTDPGELPEHFHSPLQDWLEKTSSPDFTLCNTHLGLICNPSQSKCTCQPTTKWISPPGKCLLSPGSPCTFLNIHLQSTRFASIHSPSWFASRVLIFPAASPTCGDGLVCDSITEQTSLTPSCICLEKSSRNGECQDKSTWAELESLEHKVSKLIIPLEDKCIPPPPDIQEILDSLRESEGLSPANETWLKTRLVHKQFRICDFENHELCSEEEKVCLRNCPFEGQTHDSAYNCKINYAQRCSRVSQEYINTNDDYPTECIKNSVCLRLSTGLTEGQYALTCVCSPTYESKEFQIRDYWYGPKCSLNPKSFWLGLFKPFQSGKSGDAFIAEEMEIDSQLKIIESHLIRGHLANCDPSKEPEVLKTLSYFGNNHKLDSTLYNPLLNESLHSVGINDFCNFKKFLRCDVPTNSCLTFDSRFILKPDTLSLHFAQGQLCRDPLPPDIPKVFYSNEEGSPEEITCISNSFCVIDLSQPSIEDFKFTGRMKPNGATCHCPRNASGTFCNETLNPLAPYNPLETKRLDNLLNLVFLKSTLDFGELCFLEVEEPLESLQVKTSADTDLYRLFDVLSPLLVLKEKVGDDDDDFDFAPALGLCDKREFLRCAKVPTDPLSPRSSSTVATCDCTRGYERKYNKCYISDGEPCGRPSDEGSSCASGKCSIHPLPSGETLQHCEEDLSHRYVVPKTSSSPEVTAYSFVVILIILIISSLPSLSFIPSPVVH